MIELRTQTESKSVVARRALKVPLEVDAEEASTTGAAPISLGIPFPQNALRQPFSAALCGASLGDIPVQVEPLMHWPDGSVKWLSADFLLPPGFDGQQDIHLLIDSSSSFDPERSPLYLDRHAGTRRVFTGTNCFHLPTTVLQPLVGVASAPAATPTEFASSIGLVDRRGRSHTPVLDHCNVESSGPVRLTVCMDGHYPAIKGLRLRLRESFYAGTGLVCLNVTLHNSRRARHRSGIWDLGDSGSRLIKDFSLHIDLPQQRLRPVVWSMNSGGECRVANDSSFHLYQDSSGGENWNSANHVNRDGRVPCRFRGYELTVGTRPEAGHRASPVVHLATDRGNISVAVPEFWQQFPKALSVEKDHLRVGLFPQEFDDLFELQGGERKAHTVWLNFGEAGGNGNPNTHELNWVHHPISVRLSRDWCDESGALPALTFPVSHSSRHLGVILNEAKCGPQSIATHRENVDEYGWRNYGDIFADHEQLHYHGPQPLISHYNNQFDMVQGFLLQFLRNGDRTWFEWADALARHVTDIDIYHTTEDRAAYNGGLFWFTDHYLHAHTSTHRTYSRHNRWSWRQPYGGGPAPEHNFTSGLLLHYCLTGNLNSRDAVVMLADWVIAMDDGRRNILGVVDDSPTGFASGVTGVLGRAAGNSINALLDAWSLTHDAKYLQFAETLIRRCIHPIDDIDARNLLNVEKCWSYTVFLRSLSKYLELKAQAAQLDEHYAYAQASLVNYARWMLANERPYFDQVEKLEFPTETWPAQEFRKANILRLAARHVDEPLRTEMYDRGDKLGDRAWADLLRFNKRATARALAIVMIEGLFDCTSRSRTAAPAPRLHNRGDFGERSQFLPQRRRVKRALLQPSKWPQMAGRLANPIRWIRYFAGRHGR